MATRIWSNKYYEPRQQYAMVKSSSYLTQLVQRLATNPFKKELLCVKDYLKKLQTKTTNYKTTKII